MASPKTWNTRAESRLRTFIQRARRLTTLARKGPHAPWQIEINLVTAPAMLKLNKAYRRKNYATDVLSFPTPPIFRRTGYLGELVICLPVLKRQAREHKHAPEHELDVLLVHGLLHLLGFDHEEGPRQAAAMARWEAKLLGKAAGASKGLIHRANSGKVGS